MTPVRVRRFYDQTGREEYVPVPNETLQEIAAFVFEGRTLRDLVSTGELRGLDMMRHKYKRWLQQIRVAQRAMHAAPVAPSAPAVPEDWVPAAKRRRAEGASWRALAAEFGVPRTTVIRRVQA